MNEHVKTAIRWRRPDSNKNDGIIRKFNDKEIDVICKNNSKRFCFDHILESSDQCEVYEVLVRPLVEKAFEGYDCTFIASGQTGSGKTYTMGFENSTNSESRGMTARVLNTIFTYQSDKRVNVLISFVEVYCDQVFDLLSQKREPYQRKDHKLSDSIQTLVKSELEVLALLSQGTRNRHVRGTNMNPKSSRSHAVFTIYLRIDQSESTVRESVINLVDLAGSECSSKTGNTGQAQVEGKRINESLSALNRLIMAMSTGSGHKPYRDSVITYILKDYLQPECYLTLLGCVSPYESESGATLSTLKFVADAKLIKCTPQLNENKRSKTLMMSTPTPNLSTIQQRSLCSSHPRSEPRSRLFPGRLSATKRNGRNLLSNSTTKKIRMSSDDVGSTFDRAKVVSRLFPSTTMRRTIDESMDINWNEAFTSSVLDLDCRKMESPTKRLALPTGQSKDPSDERNLVLERLLTEKLHSMLKETRCENGINRNLLQTIFGNLMSKLFGRNATMNEMGSFHLATTVEHPMLSTLIENECSEAMSNNEKPNSDANEAVESLNGEPIKDQIASVTSTNELHLEPRLLDVSVKFDHIERKVFIELNKPSDDDEVNQGSVSLDHMDENVTIQENEKSRTDDDNPMNEDQSIYMIIQQASPSPRATTPHCEMINDDEMLDVTPRMESLPQPDSSVRVTPSDNIAMKSPPFRKHVTDQKERTPIGKLVIRKVTHSNQFENTQYSVELVQRFHRSHEISPPSCNDDQETTNSPNIRSLPFLRSRAVANNADCEANMNPQIILHRTGTIQNHFGGSQQTTRKSSYKRDDNTHRKQPVCTENSAKKPKAPNGATTLNGKVLDILNTGDEKTLQKLVTIGAKRATQIFNYRNAMGEFESIDGLLDMPFWSKKAHERFIKNNIFS